MAHMPGTALLARTIEVVAEAVFSDQFPIDLIPNFHRLVSYHHNGG